MPEVIGLPYYSELDLLDQRLFSFLQLITHPWQVFTNYTHPWLVRAARNLGVCGDIFKDPNREIGLELVSLLLNSTKRQKRQLSLLTYLKGTLRETVKEISIKSYTNAKATTILHVTKKTLLILLLLFPHQILLISIHKIFQSTLQTAFGKYFQVWSQYSFFLFFQYSF